MILLPLMILFSILRNESLDLALIRRSIALNLVLMYLAPAGLPSRCQADEVVPAAKPQVMREGTRIPPTVGRVSMLGRRWVFVPVRERDQQEQATAAAPVVKHALGVVQIAPKATRLGVAPKSTAPKTIAPSSSALTPFHTVGVPLEAVADQQRLSFEQILLQENLMLQRIVEAIQEDPTDDHWVVSGEVTEFFNENRLSIQVAQRASRR